MIRPATRDDLSALSAWAADFYEYAKLADLKLTFDPAGFERYVSGLLDAPYVCVLLAEAKGRVVGSIAGVLAPWFLDPSRAIVSELWWWIDPAYRGGEAGAALLDAFEDWGRSRGASYNCMLALKGYRDDVLARFYGRRGYLEVERHFLKEL